MKLTDFYKRDKNPIYVTPKTLERAKQKVPAIDFCDQQYDREPAGATEEVLIIFSTPRSGSTYLSDLIYNNHICLPHEYFQSHDYLPLLAERWKCLRNGKLNKERYIEQLKRFRTFDNGYLGIKVHGEHLDTFSQFEPWLNVSQSSCFHLLRKDMISQAISYEIAEQTGQWTNKFESHTEATYNFNGIVSKIERISLQNCLIQAYAFSKQLPMTTIYYEDLIHQPDVFFEQHIKTGQSLKLETRSNVARQDNSLKREWKERFSNDLIKNHSLKRFNDITTAALA